MNLARAVSATVEYASFFDFPLYPHEIRQWLIGPRVVSFKKLSPHLPKISPADVARRKNTDSITRKKIQHSLKLVPYLKGIPFLRMVAITGSVAASNAKKNDDIDLLFVVSAHTLWIARPLVLFLISLFFRRRYPQEDPTKTKDAFCPNMWLDTLSLETKPTLRSLYTAHEVLQILPLIDKKNTYQSFLASNSWVKKYLANAYFDKFKKNIRADINLGSYLLAPINLLLYFLQYLYMYPKKTTELVGLHEAHLHTTDYSSKLSHIIK